MELEGGCGQARKAGSDAIQASMEDVRTRGSVGEGRTVMGVVASFG